ncbi:MAG TPA: hypothetical protein VF364_03255 [Candidatus Limnocylindria bacterium]
MEELARDARQYGALIEAAGIVASLMVTIVPAVIASRSLGAANEQAKASAKQELVRLRASRARRDNRGKLPPLDET